MPLPYEVRAKVCEVIDAHSKIGEIGRQGVLDAVTNLTDKFYSPEFNRYRESFGKLALMMPENEHVSADDNPVFANYAAMLSRMAAVRTYALTDRIDEPEFEMHLGVLATQLAVMDEHHAAVNAAFKSQS